MNGDIENYKSPVMVEKHYRTIVKTVSWRITGTITTVAVSLAITGELKFALSIGAAEFACKIVLFYLHERLWNKTQFGRIHPSEDYNI